MGVGTGYTCGLCGSWVALGYDHNCTGWRYYWWPMNQGYAYPTLPMAQPRLIEGQKCDLCGSTAIDHTDGQCAINQQKIQVMNAHAEKLNPETKPKAKK